MQVFCHEIGIHSGACRRGAISADCFARAGGWFHCHRCHVAEARVVALGWSAKRQILGQPVFNDKDERIGSIDDIIVAPDKAVSYAIINAGGFLGMTKHDVAIPVSQLKLVDKKLVLAGATKDALKASPPFEYPK